MKLEQIPKNHIKESVPYNNGTVIIIDEEYIPYDIFDSPKKALAYFDSNNNLLWFSNGLENEEFWQSIGDSFTGFYLYDDGDPVVTTFSCHVYDVNMANGNLMYRDMTK